MINNYGGTRSYGSVSLKQGANTSSTALYASSSEISLTASSDLAARSLAQTWQYNNEHEIIVLVCDKLYRGKMHVASCLL